MEPARDVGDAATEFDLVRASWATSIAMRLAAWEELPHARSWTVSAVSVRLHRARGRLAGVLDVLERDAEGGGA